jgi:primosomal protein N' (replication factor Y)
MVRCHHCEAEKLLPSLCPQCSKKLTLFGLGTQRVERELARKLPELRVARMDSDAMRTGQDYHDTLGAFGRGEVDVLLGTQMIAKGLDFAGVKLVGVVCADTSLHLPDFRAAERTFQLVAQVSGRAGRGADPGRVILQSFNVSDPTIQQAASGDYAGFADRELTLRREAGLPPATRMARVVMRDADPVKLTARARELGGSLQRLGPMVCPIARVADFHRQQVELLSPSAAPLQRLLTAARNRLGLVSDQRTAIDVDPTSVL